MTAENTVDFDWPDMEGDSEGRDEELDDVATQGPADMSFEWFGWWLVCACLCGAIGALA